MSSAQTTIGLTFAAYLALMLFLGWRGYRSTRDLSDFVLGGRRLGSWVAALSAGASDMSGWLLLGLPGAIYAGGMKNAWIAVGLTISSVLLLSCLLALAVVTASSASAGKIALM